MFTLQVDAPADWEFELDLLGLDVVNENIDCICVCQSLERCLNYLFQSIDKLDMFNIVILLLFAFCFFLHVHYFKALKEFHVSVVVFENVLEAELKVILSAVHIVFEGSERDLWFNHPEFAQVARCVRVFSSESWAKGVAIGKTGCIGLNVQLTTYTKECWSTEHVF